MANSISSILAIILTYYLHNVLFFDSSHWYKKRPADRAGLFKLIFMQIDALYFKPLKTATTATVAAATGAGMCRWTPAAVTSTIFWYGGTAGVCAHKTVFFDI